MNIDHALVEKVRSLLGEGGIFFFRRNMHEKGCIAPILIDGVLLHPVHFREGMQVRNFMRGSGLCDGWDDHDYDNNWEAVVAEAIKGTCGKSECNGITEVASPPEDGSSCLNFVPMKCNICGQIWAKPFSHGWKSGLER